MNSIVYCIKNISESSKLRQMDEFIQHGDTTCLKHTLAVAYFSMRLAEKLGISYKREELIRGALLHDYFLYDWHDGNGRRTHGFTHPKTALMNAERDFELTDTERDIIKKHMFPLTPVPPKCREAWIVCIVDKACSIYETLQRRGAYARVNVGDVCGFRSEIENME